MEEPSISATKQTADTTKKVTAKPWVGRLVTISPRVANLNNIKGCEEQECSGDCGCDGDAGPPNRG